MQPARVAVLGAGLQGVCAALELARRGARVLLVERDAVALNRASLRNEGKIHLGLVYAQSPTLETARLMLRGALSLRRLLSGWTGGRLERLRVSTPFRYMVAEDSQLGPDELEAHYASVEDLYRETGGDYLGARPDRLWRRLAKREYERETACVQAGFATEEASVDLEHLAAELRLAVRASPLIESCFGVNVEAVEKRAAGYRVAGAARGGAPWAAECEQVVNALWDGRLAVDGSLGRLPARPWVHRLKYRVLADLPERMRGLASMTFVLGAYGDIVTQPGAPAYVSWYPECMRGWSEDVSAPPSWDAACRGEMPPKEQLQLGRRALKAFDKLAPGLGEARVRTVDAGVIFAWGDRDITERESGLHRRDEIGVDSADGYHTVNTGKLTTAPLFAVQAADRVLGSSE